MQLVAAVQQGEPWHGPSLSEALAGVDERAASRRPLGPAHSIVEIALHLAAWREEVAARLRGEPPHPPAAGDWPVPDEAGDWDAARARLEQTGAALRAALAELDPRRLDDRVGAARDRALGTGVDLEEMVLGVALHDAYHAGQVALLRKAPAAPQVAGEALALRVGWGRYAVCRLAADAALPAWLAGGFWSAKRSGEELSLVVEEARVPADAVAERGLRLLAVRGPIPFATTGVMATLATALAAAGVSIFALATYDTDYLLVAEPALARAVEALRAAGCRVEDAAADPGTAAAAATP